ncbi:hypothetical protein ACHAXS_008896 [Conticribra weissflogii]
MGTKPTEAAASSPSGQANNLSKSKGKATDPRTLFVKFHPPSAIITRQHLSDHFSNYGPVNRCSVIRQSKSMVAGNDGGEGNEDVSSKDRGSKGYGFVRFVHEEDAIAAAEAIRQKSQQQHGKQRNKKNQKSLGGEIMIVDGVSYKIHAERAVDANNAPTLNKKKDVALDKTKDADKKNSKIPATKPSVKNEIDNELKVEATLKSEAKRKRTSRVILRNLSFYANEKHVKNAMEAAFGTVSAVDLPLVPSLPGDDENTGKKKKSLVPRHRGFAFVTFENASSAKKAVEEGEEIKIKNRVVAIDFSVSKVVHKKMMQEEKEGRDETDEKAEGSESEDDDGSSSSDGEEESNDEDGSSTSSTENEVNDNSDGEKDSESSSEEDDDGDNDSAESEEDDASEAKPDKQKPQPTFDESESRRTLFLRNIPFDATRHDIFELFRTYGRIQAVYLVKDPQTGVFKGTAFVRFEKEEGCAAALEAAGVNSDDGNFLSSKNMVMGLGQDSGVSGLMLKGRNIFVDLAVDRTTASSLAVQRDADGKPLKKMIGKDRRNLYLKNEGRVSSSTESAAAISASAKHGGLWEDLPQSDRAKRERAFADKSTKLRSPLFFINPTRLSIRNLAKHVNEADLKRLVVGALKKGLEQKLVTPNDAVAHWRAGGELSHSEVLRRATDPKQVTPVFDEKNTKESIPSVFIDRDLSGGKRTADAPSRGFGFVEFTHHTHALAVLRQLNNNPVYSAEFASGGKRAAEMLKQQQKKGKKAKKMKVDESGAEFVGEDGNVRVPRLIVEFAVENKVKARQQAERIAQKKANKIKQKIENKEKQTPDKKEKKKSRGALQRAKKRARKEAGEDANADGENAEVTKNVKKLKTEEKDLAKAKAPVEAAPKLVKPPKKRKVDPKEEALEDMIRSYKASFSRGSENDVDDKKAKESKVVSREKIVKKRWFE